MIAKKYFFLIPLIYVCKKKKKKVRFSFDLWKYVIIWMKLYTTIGELYYITYNTKPSCCLAGVPLRFFVASLNK